MKIEFSAKDKPNEWFETIAGQFKSGISDSLFEIPASLGQGFLKQVCFFKGFTLTYLYFKLLEPLEFIRHAIPEALLFPIMFYSQDIPLEQNINEQKNRIGYHTSKGIFMPSPQIESRWIIPAGIEGYQVTLTIEKSWFIQTVSHSEAIYLNQLLKSGKPFYLFESLSTNMNRVIKDIHTLINPVDKTQNLKLLQKSVELFNLFTEQVEQRSIIHSPLKIKPADIDAIFRVRQQLLEKITHLPSLKELSLDAGMSVSKLQKCFQQVCGKNISQYALHEKMNLAKEMLASKKYSVSEVGYQLGYSNLSHFSKAFNKKFGVKPKEYLSSL